MSHDPDVTRRRSTAGEPAGPGGTAGQYRIREGVRREGPLLVSTRPLVVTRVNDAAVGVLEALSDGEFRSPAAVADESDTDAGSVATLLSNLHDRGLLAWRPGRDPDYRPPVSVVVTVRDDATALRGCLDALADLEYPDYEVVVVDDGSTDDTRETLGAHSLSVRHVRVGSPDDPLGIGASRNRGVAAATGEVVAFTDADCRPRPDWLAQLVPVLAEHDVVGGRVRPIEEGSLSAYEGVNSSLDMGPRAARVRPGTGTPYIPTANLVGRRSTFRAVGFPERDVAEDVGFCWSALDAGHDVVYDPAGVVDHDYGTSARHFAARRRAYGASEALLATEFPTSGAVPVSPLAAAGAVVAALVAGVLSGALLPGRPLPTVDPLLAVGAGGLVGGIVAGAGSGWSAVRAYRRAGGVVSVGALAGSLGRRALSTAYALAREVTRYYALPVGVLAAAVSLGAAAGPPGAGWIPVALVVGIALWATLAAAVAVPAVVEYAVHRPGASPLAYCGWSLLDHLAYGIGAYRGALAHRTVAHLDPRNRFTIGGSAGG